MYNKKLIQRIGISCCLILLKASENNTIDETSFLEMAHQMSPEIAGKVKRHLKKKGYLGRSSMQYLLNTWNQQLPLQVSRSEIIRILQSEDIRLNDLAYDMAESVEDKLKWAIRHLHGDTNENRIVDLTEMSKIIEALFDMSNVMNGSKVMANEISQTIMKDNNRNGHMRVEDFIMGGKNIEILANMLTPGKILAQNASQHL